MSSIFPPDSTFLSAFGELVAQEETPIVTLSFPYNINAAYATTTVANGGTVTQANSQAVLQTSAANNGSAILESNFAARYSPGQGMVWRGTAAFTTGVASSRQEIGIGDASDGFFFGYQGATFGIFRRQDGTDTFVAQSAWNGGPALPTTFDPTKGNVYQIRYQWLGYGAIRYYIENPATGELALVHTIYYPNTAVVPSIFNPSLPLHARVVNSGNATNLTLLTASMGAYAEGPLNESGAAFATGANKTGVTTEIAVFSVRNNATFQSKTNRGRCRLDTFAWSFSNLAVARIVLNPTLGGSPSFTDINSNQSIAAVDTAGTTVTGGREIRRIVSGGSQQWNESVLTPIQFRWNPGDILTFTTFTTGGGIIVNLGASWREEL